MKKRVIAINSSKRKKNTYMKLEEIKSILAEQNVEMDIINLFDYDIKECVGCEQCILTDKCNLRDDVKSLMSKLKEYDGIIISSPVYMGNISGKLKIFIDRTCKWFHRPELVGKPALAVVTTGGSGLKETLGFIEKTLITWGAMPLGKIGRTIVSTEEKIKESEVKKFIKYLKIDKSEYSPTTNQIALFSVQKALSNIVTDIDKEYWNDKGWTNQSYFYKCKVSIPQKLFHKMLYKRILKNFK